MHLLGTCQTSGKNSWKLRFLRHENIILLSSSKCFNSFQNFLGEKFCSLFSPFFFFFLNQFFSFSFQVSHFVSPFFHVVLSSLFFSPFFLFFFSHFLFNNQIWGETWTKGKDFVTCEKPLTVSKTSKFEFSINVWCDVIKWLYFR